VHIEIINQGSIPASNINFQWFIRTDKDPEILAPDKFFEGAFGGSNPFPTTLAAGQKIVLPIYNPDISPVTTEVHLNVVVTYEGTTQNYVFGNYKKYWFVAREYFSLSKEVKDIQHDNVIFHDVKSIVQIKNYREWDRNSNIAPPTVKE
jgi:hypothetical protein